MRISFYGFLQCHDTIPRDKHSQQQHLHFMAFFRRERSIKWWPRSISLTFDIHARSTQSGIQTKNAKDCLLVIPWIAILSIGLEIIFSCEYWIVFPFVTVLLIYCLWPFHRMNPDVKNKLSGILVFNDVLSFPKEYYVFDSFCCSLTYLRINFIFKRLPI